jgi:hypothetical protein
MDFLRAAGQVVELASDDRRLVAAARGMKLATLSLG